MRVILDAKCEKADLYLAMETQFKHLTITQRNELLKLSQKIKEFFHGTLGTWKSYPVDFELKEGVNPICSRPYPVQKEHNEVFKNEFESLVLLGLLEVENDLE